MSEQEILNNLKSLSRTQGFYSKLYNELNTPNNPTLKLLAEQGFDDVVDLVMFLEG